MALSCTDPSKIFCGRGSAMPIAPELFKEEFKESHSSHPQ
jgi:hypothetical protein